MIERCKTWTWGCVSYLDWVSECQKWNSAATSEVIKEQAKVIWQEMDVTFLYEIWYVFCSRNEIIVIMMDTV